MRCPGGRPRSVHNVSPSGPTTAISLTGIVLKVARRIVSIWPGSQASTPRVARPSSAPTVSLMLSLGERDRAPRGSLTSASPMRYQYQARN